jgi:hypothetical protein
VAAVLLCASYKFDAKLAMSSYLYSNQEYLKNADQDLGSGGVMVILDEGNI